MNSKKPDSGFRFHNQINPAKLKREIEKLHGRPMDLTILKETLKKTALE